MPMFDLGCVYNDSVCVHGCIKWVGAVSGGLLQLRVYGNTGLHRDRVWVWQFTQYTSSMAMVEFECSPLFVRCYEIAISRLV